MGFLFSQTFIVTVGEGCVMFACCAPAEAPKGARRVGFVLLVMTAGLLTAFVAENVAFEVLRALYG